MGMEGSGFDDIVKVFCGELEHMGGRFYKNGEISCLDVQKSQIFRTSIRENIVLSSKFDQQKFDNVLTVVGFNIDKFHGKDRYIIQKIERFGKMDTIKLLLARLIYQDSDIYVIHNLFTEVTKTVAKRIFDSVIKEFLCCNTVIYSSNEERLVKRADLVLVFHKGTLISKGHYEKLIKEKDSFFYRLIKKGDTNSHINDEFKRMQENQLHASPKNDV